MAKKKIITKNTKKVVKRKIKPMAKSKAKEHASKKPVEKPISKVSDPVKESIDEANKRKEKEAFDSVKEALASGAIKEGESWQIPAPKEEKLSAEALHDESVQNNLANKG